jgi:hypothetical protein
MRQQRLRKETPRSPGRRDPRKGNNGRRDCRSAAIGRRAWLQDHRPGYAIAEFPKGNQRVACRAVSSRIRQGRLPRVLAVSVVAGTAAAARCCPPGSPDRRWPTRLEDEPDRGRVGPRPAGFPSGRAGDDLPARPRRGRAACRQAAGQVDRVWSPRLRAAGRALRRSGRARALPCQVLKGAGLAIWLRSPARSLSAAGAGRRPRRGRARCRR